ncbi:hypothetical protein ACWD4L_38290 [Streptomyces sp. NPDC002596]|uniref:hypothetical protein n=1 Tax=Streptomyces sp. NPDC059460 TaxID=3346840 RepID=UPI00367DAB4C
MSHSDGVGRRASLTYLVRHVGGRAGLPTRTLETLWEVDGQGRLPVVCDAASCPHGLKQLPGALPQSNRARFTFLRVDSVALMAEHLLPVPPELRRLGSLALHLTCSTVHLGIDSALRTVAAAVSDEVTVPDNWGCCAFAGGRGLL